MAPTVLRLPLDLRTAARRPTSPRWRAHRAPSSAARWHRQPAQPARRRQLASRDRRGPAQAMAATFRRWRVLRRRRASVSTPELVMAVGTRLGVPPRLVAVPASVLELADAYVGKEREDRAAPGHARGRRRRVPRRASRGGRAPRKRQGMAHAFRPDAAAIIEPCPIASLRNNHPRPSGRHAAELRRYASRAATRGTLRVRS